MSSCGHCSRDVWAATSLLDLGECLAQARVGTCSSDLERSRGSCAESVHRSESARCLATEQLDAFVAVSRVIFGGEVVPDATHEIDAGMPADDAGTSASDSSDAAAYKDEQADET